MDLNSTFYQWKPLTNYSDYELQIYISYYTWQNVVSSQMLRIQVIIRFFVSLIGSVGSVIELVVLQQKKNLSFMYHQIIAFFDFMVVFGSVIGMINRLADPNYSASFLNTWYNVVHAGVFSFASFVIKLAVSVERIVAVWFPQKFDKINNYKVVIIAIVLSLLHGSEYWVDFWRKDLLNNKVYSAFVGIRAAVQLGVGFSLMLASVIVSIGLIRVTKKQKKVHDLQTMRQKEKINRQLVYLSLSCSLPLFIDSAMFGCTTLANGLCGRGTLVCPVGTSAVQLPFEEAMHFAHWNLRTNWVTTVDNIIWTIGEAGHFYFYFLLCTPFREATLELFRKLFHRKPAVGNNDAIILNSSNLSKANF